MTNIILFGILIMMVIMTVGSIVWWRKNGKKLTTLISHNTRTSNEKSKNIREFKVPNQWG